MVWTPKTPLSAGQHNVVFSLTGATSSGATYESPLTSNFSMNVTGNAFVNSWNVNKPGTQKFDITSSDTIVDTNRLDYTGMQSGDVLSGDSNVTNAFNLSQYSDAVLDFKVTIKTPLSTSGATYQVEVILQKFVNGVWIEIEKKPYSYAGASSAVTASTALNPSFNLKNLTNIEEQYRLKLSTSNIGTAKTNDVNASFELTGINYNVTSHKLSSTPSDKSTAYGVDGNLLPIGKTSTDYDIWIKTTSGYQKVTTTVKTSFDLSNALFHVTKEGVFNFDPVNELNNIGKIDGFEYKLVNKSTGFETFHKQEIEIRADGVIMNYGENADIGTGVLSGSASSDVMISRGANETITSGSGQDWLVYNVLKSSDATGGNGSDIWTDFNKASSQSAGDIIDISSLLSGQGVTAENIGQFVTVESGTNTVIKIDRDGGGSTHSSTTLITLNNVNTNLEE